MEYSHDDADLLRQPIGYWSWAAYDAVVSRTRAALGRMGATQPQWWILAQVASDPRTRDEVTGTLAGYLDTGAEAVRAGIDDAVARGWVAEDPGGTLRLTTEGRAFHAEARAVQDDLRKERHAGISDEEYLITLKTLQRFIHNTRGRAWHH
ncbi:MarR family winged helix-turn-helix transcriptional regulator [Streptomyces sp. SHP 1-2]|uniref:MarR family winged helix-turn-helix transcriptional regulator n=1 Tax=Streptomyces sp. SHP 1-2 TaxID=2769489 RepID=UPI00223884F7|nr:MarR family winged helix-turn-helix transcriptional regulator [Streptomyces sp. SHP 1-2]MCW5253025.1 winged helix-turn-helix transcriptional regulator [Streptomyces sp. SHP 1-2]